MKQIVDLELKIKMIPGKNVSLNFGISHNKIGGSKRTQDCSAVINRWVYFVGFNDFINDDLIPHDGDEHVASVFASLPDPVALETEE